jgi:hypothetical protein
MDPPDTDSYQYIDVTASKEAVIEEAVLEFTVANSWLTEKGYTPHDIVMTVNENGNWANLPTELVNEVGDPSYKATTPHLSIFAIIYVKGATVDTSKSNASATAAPTTEIPTLAVTSAPPSPQGTATAPETAPPAPVPTRSPGFAAVSAFGGIGAVAFLAARRK